ncbi:MAG: RNase adapter RapZ [Clostridia bacterium]|nr:RNase adapter RapZ [Clostridia bacterium]
MRYILVTGMSGAGKTAALRYLEDTGAFCVDNVPPMLLPRMTEMFENTGTHLNTVVFAVDVRSGEFFDANAVAKLIREMRQVGQRIELIFMDASDDTLVSRYKETRREHPLASDECSLTQAIARERTMLQPLRETANYLIDTTGLRTRALQKRLAESLAGSENGTPPIRVEVLSFGFKRGLPRQADLVLDVRFLPNPYYIETLCRHSGLDEDVRAFVMEHPVTVEFMNRMKDMLNFLLPNYREEGKHRLVIAVGCTGGAHRSVAIAEAIGAYLREQGYTADVDHRDLQIEQAHWTASADEEY